MEDSRVKKVSELLSSFFDGELAAKGEKYVEFSNSWRTIAGARLGEHSRPAEIRRGMLIVEAEHSGWIQLLQLHQEKILAEIQRRYPDLEVRGVAFVIGNGAPADSASPAAADQATPAEAAMSAFPGAARKPAEAEEAAQSAASVPGNDSEPAREATGAIPPELLAKFEKIRKNIEKR